MIVPANDVPLAQWPRSWLVLQVSSILEDPLYVTMSDAQRRAEGLPVSEDDMRVLILADRELQ